MEDLPLGARRGATSLDARRGFDPGDLPEFDHRLQLTSSLALYWSLDEGADAEFFPAMRGRMVKEGGGWASVAFSKDGFMVASEAVIGEPGSPPEAYVLGAKSTAGVRRTADVTLRDAGGGAGSARPGARRGETL